MFNNCKEEMNLAYRNMDCKLQLDEVNNRTDKICLCFGVKEIKISLDVTWILFIIHAFINKRVKALDSLT